MNDRPLTKKLKISDRQLVPALRAEARGAPASAELLLAAADSIERWVALEEEYIDVQERMPDSFQDPPLDDLP